MLQYDLAMDSSTMGCICQSMIQSDKQELNEGGKYLQAFDNTFEPDDKSTRSRYSFQLIQKAFEAFNLEKYMDCLLEVIVLDALIGNGDRHQENWAFITTHGRISSLMNHLNMETKDPALNDIPKWLRSSKGFKFLVDEQKGGLKEAARLIKLYYQNVESFSPIYDSGSSLGREFSMKKVEQMLRDRRQLEAYIMRGTSEIHWDGQKVNHFTLLQNLLNTSYFELVDRTIKRVAELFDGTKIEAINQGIDKLVPEKFSHFKLPPLRKQLIIKMVTLRSQKISALIHDGI